MIDDYIFYKNLPTLDLHGEDRVGAKVKINEFIYDNYRLKNKLIIVVHGIGSGILRKTTLDTLKNNKYIKECKIDIYNPGATIIELNIDN